MRKILGLLLVAVVGVALLAYTYTAEAAEKKITISEMQGKVQIKEAGASSWKLAEWGMRLGSGDTVRTGAGAYADLSFNGMAQTALVRVEASSEMAIDTFTTSKIMNRRKILLDLAIGEVLVKANKLKNQSQFQVRTPTSIVGVRGTGFKVKVTAEQ
ncbi:MAG: FecR domain-containing protein [Candidatus Omnitrophota bacterium]